MKSHLEYEDLRLRIRHPLYCICSVLLGLSLALTSRADVVGKVVRVADGDTVTVLDKSDQQHKIRLTGIDAPERGQPFGTASRDHLTSLVAGKEVQVESSKRDRYDRVLGKIILDGKDINLIQVQAGMAWWYRHYAKQQSPKDRALYESAEDKAKAMKLGLWGDANPVPPWDYRRGKKDKGRVIAMPEGCGPKRYCKEMDSCEEAKFYLSKCGLTTLDGNTDGIPCNSLCI